MSVREGVQRLLRRGVRPLTATALTALGATLALTTTALTLAQPVQARSVTHNLDIPAQSLDDALQALALASQHKLLYSSEIVDGKVSVAIKGQYTTAEAVKQLLSATDLAYEVTGDGLVIIEQQAAKKTRGSSSESSPADKGAQNKSSFWGRFRVAQADASTAGVKQEESSLLEEIVVTATKREENLQDVPISISVISGTDIERRGLMGMEDYLRSVPGVSQVDRGGLDNSIVIRGISTSSEFENLNSGTTVATYFDETPITGAGGLGTGNIDVRPVDMQRIEILRGPQGTTFGSASLGGAVRLIPAQPKLDAFSAKVAANYSQTSGHGSDNSMVQGVVNVPLVVDKLALRGVAYRYEDSGFYKNIAGVDAAEIAFAERFGLGDYVRGHIEDNVGEMVATGGRAAVLWQATEDLDVSVNFLTQKVEQTGLPVASSGRFEQSRVPIAPQGRVRGEDGEISDNDIDLINAVANYDFGWARLTTAVSSVDSGSIYTNSRTRFAPGLGPSSGSARSDFESFTAETRLASTFDGKFQFLGGVFYEDVDQHYLQHSGDWPGAPADNPFVTDPMFLADFTRKLEQRALFGEISYEVTDKLTATVGGRYYDYDKESRNIQEGGNVGFIPGTRIPLVPIGAGVPQVLANSEDGSTFKASLDYKPSEQSLLYISWSEGFRLGRPDPGVLPGLCDTNGDGLIDGTNVTIESTRQIDSDNLENYEIGGKAALLDRRMVIDASVYHIKWDGLPVRAVATCGTSSNSYTANVGEAESNGAELQASLFLIDGLRIDFGAGYVKAKLTKDALSLLPPAFEGDRLPGSPELTGNLAAQFDFAVGGYDAFVRADSMYVGEFYGDFRQTPGVRAGDYVKVDTRFGLQINSLSVELFVRNITNEDAFTWRGISGAQSGAVNPDFGYRLRPRTIGVQLGYSFD